MSDDIFRREAIQHHLRSPSEADALLLLPRWGLWTYRLLIGALIAATAFVSFAFVPEYAEGPALVRAQQRVSVTATSTGVVASIEVARGSRVRSGDLLVRLRSVEEDAEIVSLQREFDSALVRMLANPLDQSVRQTLGTLRARKELLGARLEERLVRAPEAGTIGDVRIRTGQSVSPGDFVLSLARPEARFSVTALLPGRQRPSLREGQPLRLELTGYQYAYHTLTIERVDDEIVGPAEVRRVLGPEVGDAIPVSGPIVVVHGYLVGTSFVSRGVTYDFFDGMHGIARARVRSERLLMNLIPAIKRITEPAQ